MELYVNIAVFITLCFLQTVVCKHVQVDNFSCAQGHYFNQRRGICKQCTICPNDNYIIDVPCGGMQDTKCAKFKDFFRKFKPNQFNVHAVSSTKTPMPSSSVDDTEESSAIFEMSDEWYIISMVLLGVLCIVGAAITIYIIVACFVCKKKVQDKEIIYEPEMISPGNHVICTDTLNYVTPASIPGRFASNLTSISEEEGQQVAPLLVAPNLYVNYEYIEPKDSLLLQNARQASK